MIMCASAKVRKAMADAERIVLIEDMVSTCAVDLISYRTMIDSVLERLLEICERLSQLYAVGVLTDGRCFGMMRRQMMVWYAEKEGEEGKSVFFKQFGSSTMKRWVADACVTIKNNRYCTERVTTMDNVGL